MTETKHTPGPLGLYDVADKRTRITNAEADIAEMIYGDVPDEETEETAARLVLCYNVHDDLLAACKAAALELVCVQQQDGAAPSTDATIQTLLDAIAKAEGVRTASPAGESR